MAGLDRARFLGLALAAAGSASGAGALAASAYAASGPLADQDLAVTRLAAASELLSADFYAQALDAGILAGDAARWAKRIAFNEGEHLAAVNGILTGAGQPASSADDFDFGYPDGTFASRAAFARVAVAIETASVGIYAGAAGLLALADLRTAAARIAASEGQHLAFVTRLAGGRPVGVSFPAALDLASASDALAPFLS